MIWSNPSFIVTGVAGVASVIAVLYAWLPYRANKRAASRDQFVTERQYLDENRLSLTAKGLAERSTLVTPSLPGMLSPPEWIPSRLLPLADISMTLDWG